MPAVVMVSQRQLMIEPCGLGFNSEWGLADSVRQLTAAVLMLGTFGGFLGVLRVLGEADGGC